MKRLKFAGCGKDMKLSENVKIKIADLGNACWSHHHFSTEI